MARENRNIMLRFCWLGAGWMGWVGLGWKEGGRGFSEKIAKKY